MELKERIINAAIDVFTVKGLKFTMDDIAKHLSISKKTIYSVFSDKEEMLLAVADYSFAEIKRSEKAVATDDSLDIVEKIKKIMVVLPDRYQNIGLNNLYLLKDKYPKAYERVYTYLATDWDVTIALLEEGIKEGKIRNISIPIVRAMVEGTINQFISDDILVTNQITYDEALENMIDIIIRGIEA